jgi:peptide chain release factor 2
MRDLTKLRRQVSVWESVSASLEDALVLAELGDEELKDELTREVHELADRVGELEFQALFSGEYNDEDAILNNHAGDGDTEAQD